MIQITLPAKGESASGEKIKIKAPKSVKYRIKIHAVKIRKT